MPHNPGGVCIEEVMKDAERPLKCNLVRFEYRWTVFETDWTLSGNPRHYWRARQGLGYLIATAMLKDGRMGPIWMCRLVGISLLTENKVAKK